MVQLADADNGPVLPLSENRRGNDADDGSPSVSPPMIRHMKTVFRVIWEPTQKRLRMYTDIEEQTGHDIDKYGSVTQLQRHGL